MPAPATDEQKTDIYSSAKLRVTYTDGTSRAYPLAYQELMGTTDLGFLEGPRSAQMSQILQGSSLA